ncbi:hypothetical protein [Chengkuizengella marina]|uniref:Uncharacterized protein n=1 Tax=Chengkuizengella marina TaxID=2507566 RepID=A0A6N9PYB2_9BACL|nr:hypothetical protein [Chengkuizengella marina]NBI27802.1 hypothetical protein [Chengkuizengella marina]
MADFKKETKKISDFRDDTVKLTEDKEVVILEVKVCVKDPKENVVLIWSVDEDLRSSDFADLEPSISLAINSTVEYRLCRIDKHGNSQQLGSTITSSESNSLELSADNTALRANISFIRNTQPNSTFCDNPPHCGEVFYQVKAKKLPPDGDPFISQGKLTDRSLVAIY